MRNYLQTHNRKENIAVEKIADHDLYTIFGCRKRVNVRSVCDAGYIRQGKRMGLWLKFSLETCQISRSCQREGMRMW